MMPNSEPPENPRTRNPRTRPQPTSGPRARRNSKTEPGKAGGAMRIAKAMAQAGLCSRREAERWLADGRVTVNGAAVTSPALDVKSTDRIVVDGKPLPQPEPTRLWRYHKPKGLVTTHRDPQGRDTVFDNLPDDLPRVISIGRLDLNTEGLLLLTTDGELARHLELPATGWLRRYRVRAHGSITQSKLDTLEAGCEIDGIRYGPIEAKLESQKGANCWIAIGLREGKNREVRNVLASLGLTVNRLIRVSYGPFQLLDLKPGEAEQVKRKVLREQLGPTLAERFGLDAATILEEERAAQAAQVAGRGTRGPGKGSSSGSSRGANQSAASTSDTAKPKRSPGRKRPPRPYTEKTAQPRRPRPPSRGRT
jgi:23S rRNA pseudouridine2605 synthase